MSYEDISLKLDEIEAEMKKLAIHIPLNSQRQAPQSAFGGGEMAFEEWLGALFLPSPRTAVASKKVPRNSQVGVAAVRNFDGRNEMDDLTTLLCEFDRLVEST